MNPLFTYDLDLSADGPDMFSDGPAMGFLESQRFWRLIQEEWQAGRIFKDATRNGNYFHEHPCFAESRLNGDDIYIAVKASLPGWSKYLRVRGRLQAVHA